MYILLLPTLLAIHDHVLEAPVCHADQTPWRMMDNKGGTKRWWLWTNQHHAEIAAAVEQAVVKRMPPDELALLLVDTTPRYTESDFDDRERAEVAENWAAHERGERLLFTCGRIGHQVQQPVQHPPPRSRPAAIAALRGAGSTTAPGRCTRDRDFPRVQMQPRGGPATGARCAPH